MKTDPPSVLPGLPRGRDRALTDTRGQTEPRIWPRTGWAWLRLAAQCGGRTLRVPWGGPGQGGPRTHPSRLGRQCPTDPTRPVHREPVAPGASQPALHSGHRLRWGFYSDGRAISPNRAGGASPVLALEGFWGLRQVWGGPGPGRGERICPGAPAPSRRPSAWGSWLPYCWVHLEAELVTRPGVSHGSGPPRVTRKSHLPARTAQGTERLQDVRGRTHLLMAAVTPQDPYTKPEQGRCPPGP